SSPSRAKARRRTRRSRSRSSSPTSRTSRTRTSSGSRRASSSSAGGGLRGQRPAQELAGERRDIAPEPRQLGLVLALEAAGPLLGEAGGLGAELFDEDAGGEKGFLLLAEPAFRAACRGAGDLALGREHRRSEGGQRRRQARPRRLERGAGHATRKEKQRGGGRQGP